MQKPKRHTVTAALPYANGPLHLGHVAGAYLPADIYVRFLRMKGEDVVFICGSDEHGAAITLRAKKEGKTPQEIIDSYHYQIKNAFQGLGISFDIYHRTSASLHHETAQEFFKKLNHDRKFTIQRSEQYFDEEHQQFLADRYISGQCPKCGNPNAYGDQCEKCGTSLSPTDLINPISTLSGKKPMLKDTSHWYLPLNEHEGWIKDWLKHGVLDGKPHHDPKEWKKHVLGQCMSWVEGGLKPRAMTRDLDWGVKVPVEGADGKVLYVWLDAPIGYISATRQWAIDNNKNWESYWKDENTRLIHFIGKDNIVFHCIIFPILLKMHGEFILPQNVPANEFLNLEGDKFSTSRNWAVWVHEYLEDFQGKQDILRYVLCSIAPENKDSEFTWKDFQARNNNELADIYGNFVNRTLVLTQKYYDGIVPNAGELTNQDKALLNETEQLFNSIEKDILEFKFRDALSAAMDIARAGNKYLADTEPWKLVKTDTERVKTIMNLAIQVTARLCVAFEPFMPHSANKLRTMLNLDGQNWENRLSLVAAGHRINTPEILFAKIEDNVIEEQIEKLKSAAAGNTYANVNPAKPEIQFTDFEKMDIRLGTITEAEKVQGADKLLKLTVDTGLDVRTVVSGIAEHYQLELLVGKQVALLVNLAPRKIRGIESKGMVLMAENSEGRLCFVSPSEVGFENGNNIR
ncbi:MAG: methionine--tRNA ligase [Flavobacteriales bacterium]